MRPGGLPSRRSPSWLLVVPAVLALAAAVAGLLIGCAANEPFDPQSVRNQRPSVRLFVSPLDTSVALNPTSYYQRTFHWSGTDADGWVREYYVSVRTQSAADAPWAATTNTETTMTFAPDETGRADATFLLACRDDRGALSDTVEQYVPLRNFPPAVNFQSDFDPLRNLQREFRDASGQVTTLPSAAVDTVYWNWGPMNFRLFALDLDGAATMDEFYRYTLADGDLLPTRDWDDPEADPNECWVRVPFNSSAEIKKFTIFVDTVTPGEERTLRVSVKDEANSDSNFRFTWEVRAPTGPLLFIPDSLSPTTRTYYENILNAVYGAGNWNTFLFWFGMPDDARVLTETFRKYAGVLWVDSGSGSTSVKAASAAGGILDQYLAPAEGTPGHLLFVSKGFVGQANGLSSAFLQLRAGVSPSSAPAAPLYLPSGKLALHQGGSLPDMATTRAQATAGVGLSVLAGGPQAEALYRMENCQCYAPPPRPSAPPYDPVVGVRTPSRAVSPLAAFVGLSVQLDVFDAAQVTAVLGGILQNELGVVAP